MEEDEASVPALQDKLRKAEQKNALLERNQKMLHEKMANIDELITKFTAANAQLKQKSQRLAHSQQEIEQLKRQLAEASAAAASYSQSLRAKTVELEATKTAMSETLQENEALMCEKSSMQALNAQLSAEIEGGSRWIDEQRAMHKELSRVRRELSYEKTRYTARAKEAVDLTLEVRKQTNENIEAREELRGLKALVKQLEAVLAERGMESVYGEAVEEVQRQQAREKQLREERELQAVRLAEKRRLERELRAETFVPYSDHDHGHGDDDEEGAEANAGLDLDASTAVGDKAGDASATKEKERQKKNEKEKKNEEDGRDLEQLLSQEIDRAMSGDGAAAATQPADTPPSGRGKGRGGRQAKDSSPAVGRLSKAMADTPAKRGRGRGRASATKLNATGPSPSADTSESASPGAKGAAGGRRPGEARGRGRGRGRGEKRKPEPSPREVVQEEEEGPTPKRKRTASVAGASSGGEPMEEGHEEDESFDEFASFLETAFDDDTDEALASRPAPPAATANVVSTPPDAMTRQANAGEEQTATPPTTGATTTTAAAALEMVHEMMMADTSLPATPITPLPSTPVALSSCPSTPIRYSSFPPPSPVRQASSSSFPSYSASASASSTPPAATPPSPSPSARSPSTPASSSSSVVSSPSSPSASPQSLRRTSQIEFEPSLFSESEQEDNADDDHQMDVPTLLRPAIDDQQQPRPADAVAASETRTSLTAALEPELAAAQTRPAIDERPSELKEKSEDEDEEGKAKAKELEKRQVEEREREDEERQREQREREAREERDRREKEKEKEKEREEEEKRKQEAAAAEQERRAKEELERRKKEAEEKEEEVKRTKAKEEEEEAKRRAREAEELRAREVESERRRKQELHEKQERERIAAEAKEREAKEIEAREKKEREIAEKAKAKAKEAKGKEKESSTDEKKEAKEATEAKRAEGEKEGKRETKRKREDDVARPPPPVVVERSRRPRELQQLYFSRRVEQLGGGGEGTKGAVVEELAEDFSDDKNIKEADLLSCLEGLVRKGRPATSPRKPTPKPKRAKQPTVDGESPQLQVGEGEQEQEQEKGEKEQEALLADLVWRVDGLRQRRQADEKAGRLKRPAEKRSTKRLAEQMVLRLEAGLCRGETAPVTTTTAPTTDARQGVGAAEARMVRLLVGLGRRLSEEAGDARARGEEEMRTWRVLVHHFTACLGAWRGWRDRQTAAADASNDEGPGAVAAFVEMLDDVAALWSDAMRIDTTADHGHDHDQHDARRRKKEAMGVVYRVVVLLLDEVTTATPGQELGQLKQRWHGVRERCGWAAIGAVDENALLADIMGYCRALGRHRDEDACKWDDETALVLRSMELLALCKGWDWTYQVLVNHVWPMLSETAPDEGHTSVAAALRLIGLMSRRAFGDSPTGHPPREGQRDKVDWLRSTLDMVIAPPPPSLDDGAPPIPVFSFRCQLAAVESLRDLFSPTDDGASLAGAKAWLASLSVAQRKRVPVALKKALA